MSYTEIRFTGSGGQGLILSAKMLYQALTMEGKCVARSQGYEPTSRGGLCFSDLVVSDSDIDYPLATGLDYLLVLDQVGVEPSRKLLKPDCMVVADQRLTPEPPSEAVRLFSVPFTDDAIAMGNHRVANIIGLGYLCAVSDLCSQDSLVAAIESETPKAFRLLNLEAMETGFQAVSR